MSSLSSIIDSVHQRHPRQSVIIVKRTPLDRQMPASWNDATGLCDNPFFTDSGDIEDPDARCQWLVRSEDDALVLQTYRESKWEDVAVLRPQAPQAVSGPEWAVWLYERDLKAGKFSSFA